MAEIVAELEKEKVLRALVVEGLTKGGERGTFDSEMTNKEGRMKCDKCSKKAVGDCADCLKRGYISASCAGCSAPGGPHTGPLIPYVKKERKGKKPVVKVDGHKVTVDGVEYVPAPKPEPVVVTPKVGDYVKVLPTATYPSFVGKFGKVAKENPTFGSLGVEFAEALELGHNLDGALKSSHGWYFFPEHLEVVK